MDNNKPSVSPETKKFLDELDDNPFEKGTWQWRMREAQKAGAFDPNRESWEPTKSIREKFADWVQFAPAPVVFVCKILKIILDVGGFIFMIIGGVAMLVSAWKILQAIDASGWRGLLDWPTLYVVGYFAAMFIINKLRWLMYRIVNGI